MKKTMFIGPIGSGKTTLYKRLFSLPLDYVKTQTLEFYEGVIDTPGEYLEDRNYYSALLVTSMEADTVALIMDCTDTQTVYPPGFTRMFTKPTIGIITKIDLLGDGEDCSFAKDMLHMAGVDQVILTSSFDDRGIDEVRSLFLEGSAS